MAASVFYGASWGVAIGLLIAGLVNGHMSAVIVGGVLLVTTGLVQRASAE